METLNYISSSDKINFPRHQTYLQGNINFSEEIENISNHFSKENMKKLIDDQLNVDLKLLTSFLEVHTKLISQIISNQKQIENDYLKIFKEINEKENDINEVIDNYSSYLMKNKTLLIRNELLHTFVSKINITKEEKDNLVTTQNSFDDNFFKLIFKMTQIKHDIDLIERNSDKFSKTLLFSIKENYNIVDDLINEKIVIYLKDLFRSKVTNLGVKGNSHPKNYPHSTPNQTFSWGEFSQIIQTLSYLRGKENYLNFILKEYTQMRKKNLEEQLRNKYLKINKLDDIFKFLIEDFEFYFVKEFVILFALFNNEDDREIHSFNREDQENILDFLNYSADSNDNKAKELLITLEGLISKIKSFKNLKDFSFYIPYMNTILYGLEGLFYENINYHKNLSHSENNFAEMYKFTILSYYYYSKIENLLKNNNFSLSMVNDNLNLFSMINNYKKSFSKILLKISNDVFKSLQKLQKTLFSGTSINEDTLGTNESILNKTIISITEDFSKCFSYYQEYWAGVTSSPEESVLLSPKQYNSFKLLVNFFKIEQSDNVSNVVIVLKVLNLIQIQLSKLNNFGESCQIQEEIATLFNLYDKYERMVIGNLTSSILKATKFEENLKKNISHEQTISLIEHIMEKSQFYFLNLNLLADFAVKELIKEKIKREILQVYKDILQKEENLNLSFFSEEEFKNYLDIL